MAEFYVCLIEGDPGSVRERPLGVYEAGTPGGAVEAARRQWALTCLEPDAFTASAMETGSRREETP